MDIENILAAYSIGISATYTLKSVIYLVQSIEGVYYNNPLVKKQDTILALLPTPFDVAYFAFKK